MPHAYLTLALNEEERKIRSASDAKVQQWHVNAKSGNAAAKRNLLCWAYLTAHDYYVSKVSKERCFTIHDAEELSSEFFLEFEQRLPQIQTAAPYTRRTLKCMLGRYIVRERKYHWRESARPQFDAFVVPIPSSHGSDPTWTSWSDTMWLQYEATLQVLQQADEITRSIVAYRVKEMSYSQIACRVNLSEAALRMRVARFYRAVRSRFNELTT